MKNGNNNNGTTADAKRDLLVRVERWRDSHKNRMVVMSARQYSMAQWINNLGTRVIDLETLSTMNQTTVRSMLIRGWLRQASPTTLQWTKEGKVAMEQFAATRFDRHASARFSSFLSLETYDLKLPANNGAA